MKKAIGYLVIAFIFISCSKEKHVSLVGSWRETATYAERTPGVYEWGAAARWPLLLTFKPGGEYSSFQEMSGSEGLYKYHPATKELIFISATSGNLHPNIVSFLDEDYMDMDYIYDGVLFVRLRFIRTQ